EREDADLSRSGGEGPRAQGAPACSQALSGRRCRCAGRRRSLPWPTVKTNALGYEVLRKLGASGVCEVLLAQRLDRPSKLVLQVLRPKLLGEPAVIRGFRQQAERCLGLSHPNIAR